MNNDEIKILLKKFYSGETSVEEENTLKKYFDETTMIPADFLADKALFDAVDANMPEAEMPVNLVKNIEVAIDEKTKNEHEKNSLQPNRVKRIIIWSVSAAASLIVLISILNMTKRNSEPEPLFISNVPMTEVEAYNLTNIALAKVSDKVLKSINPLKLAEIKAEQSIMPIKETSSKIKSINSKVKNNKHKFNY